MLEDKVSRYRALRLARRLRQARSALPDGSEAQIRTAPGITLGELLGLHGAASPGSLLLFWSLFCQLPVGGVGNVAAVALWWLSFDWWLERLQPWAPKRVLDIRLNVTWSRRILGMLAVCYRRSGRWLRPRWPLLGWRGARGWWALWIALQAGLVFLPIPLGNVLPGLSLMALGLGRLIGDGLMYLVSVLFGLGALAYTWWLGDVALRWTQAATRALPWF